MTKEMSTEEKALYQELRLMIKRANQRILSLERLTGKKETFAVKQLIDYLSSSTINGVTAKGRIAYRRDTTLMQKQAIKKAVEEFLSKSESTVRGIKRYTAKVSKLSGKKLSYKMASTYYQVTEDFTWLYDGNLTPSIFWRDFAPEVNNRSEQSWIELVAEYKSNVVDTTIKRNLEYLYKYIKGE